MPRFQKCLDDGKYATKVRTDLADGQKAGVTGTPAFFLGVTVPNDPTVKVIRVLKGAQPYASFKSAIESLLSSIE
jgi:protein-disulfide isomerase